MNLIDIALMKILMAPILAGQAGHENQNTLRTALMNAKLQTNIAAITRNHENELERKFKMRMAQTTNLPSEKNLDLVVAPAPGYDLKENIYLWNI